MNGETKANIIAPCPRGPSLRRRPSNRLLTCLENGSKSSAAVKLPGYEMVISELEVERNYLLRAKPRIFVAAHMNRLAHINLCPMMVALLKEPKACRCV